jgi:hypothetical protein
MVETSAPGIRITIPRGGTYNFKVRLKNKSNNTGFDLTGYAAKIDVMTSRETGATILFTIGTATSGITIPTPTNGIAVCQFTAAQTALFTLGQYYYFDTRFSSGADVKFSPSIEIQPLWTGTSA